jgi:hypothetical protein
MFDDSTSTVCDGVSSTQVFYELTVGTELLNAQIANNFVAYKFVSPGPPDSRRMLRAACFFQNSLFCNGLHREEIIARRQEATTSSTGAMFSAMIDAYTTATDLCKHLDADPIFYIIDIRIANGEPIMSSPVLYWIATKPTPLNFSCKPCVFCGRVQEQFNHTKDGMNCCVMCTNHKIAI